MHHLKGYFSRTFQVLEFSRKNPGLSSRHVNPAYDDDKLLNEWNG